MNDTSVEKKIKRRKVFYLAGYDPRGFRFYYGNLKTQSKKFCDRDNLSITISAKEKLSELETMCRLECDTQQTTTDYVFLNWEDFVKKSWIKSYTQLFFKGLQSYKKYFMGFSWETLLKLNRSPLITLFYPFLTLITPPLLLTGLLSGIYSDHFIWIMWLILSVFLWIKMLPKINSLWLLRFFIFNQDNFITYNHDYHQRAQKFAKIIQSSFTEEYDEIILICHSNGSIASIPILNFMTEFPDRFKVLTLGHCLPLISANKPSTEYLELLESVGQKKFSWYDIGFPPDGACYAKTNPFITHRNHNPKNNVSFHAVSSQFFNFYDKAVYDVLLKDKFKLHFNYLCTYDKPSKTEFIDILTSHRPLETRF